MLCSGAKYKNKMSDNIKVILNDKEIIPDRVEYSRGLSLVMLYQDRSIGVALGMSKLSCAQCNTPIAETFGGSLIIRSKHHSEKHVTAISIDDLMQLLNGEVHSVPSNSFL